MQLTEWVQLAIMDRISNNRKGQPVNIRQTLDTLGRRINKWYPKINNGGCCVFAGIVGNELQKRGIETNIIVGAYGASEAQDIDQIRARVNKSGDVGEWNANGVYFNHVGVEFFHDGDGFHYDTDGVHYADSKLKHWVLYPGRLTVEEAILLSQHREAWNEEFDRAQIPSLRRHIRQFLATNLPLTAAS